MNVPTKSYCDARRRFFAAHVLYGSVKCERGAETKFLFAIELLSSFSLNRILISAGTNIFDVIKAPSMIFLLILNPKNFLRKYYLLYIILA